MYVCALADVIVEAVLRTSSGFIWTESVHLQHFREVCAIEYVLP